jgi:hypothetical protein
MNGSTGTTDLWDQISPDLFRRVIEVFADHGRGVLIVPVSEEPIEWEENDK